MFDFKINKFELEALLKKVYEEGCFGYLDLQESVCQKMLNDFLTDKKAIQTTFPKTHNTQFYGYASSGTSSNTYTFYSNIPPENSTATTILDSADTIQRNEFFE